MSKNANKTVPTGVAVKDFLAGLESEEKRQDSEMLVEMMSRISGQGAVMWGSSIVGFGRQEYVYDSGRRGEMGQLGFSPRKQSLTIYFQEGFDRYGELLGRLGKHTTSVSCLYVKRLADIDLGVLEEMVRASWKVNSGTESLGKPETVAAYVSAVPTAARPKFDELRELVRELIPEAQEVLSYGIVGYKIDDKRARVFISGWKDHVAVYPVPREEKLVEELKPYIKGKGTLWFGLQEALPVGLIRRVVEKLVTG